MLLLSSVILLKNPKEILLHKREFGCQILFLIFTFGFWNANLNE